MFKKSYYIKFIRHFAALRATSRKNLTHLAISAMLRTSTYLLVPFMASEIVKGLENRDPNYTLIAIALFLAAAILYLLCHHYNYYAYYLTARDIHNTLQRKVMKKITEFDAGFDNEISKSTLIATSFRDVDHARMVPDELCDAFVRIFGMIMSVVILCFADLRIGAISAAALLLSIADFVYHTKKRDKSLSTMYTYSDEISGLYSQMIDGYKEVQTLNLKEDLAAYYEKSKSAWSKHHKKQRFHRDFAATMAPLFLSLGRVVVYCIVATLILNGESTVAMLILVVGYYEDMVARYDNICDNIDNISRSYVAIERLYKLLHYKTPHMIEFGKNNTDDISGVVEFKDVDFEYEEKVKKSPEDEKMTVQKYPGLKKMSFKAEPGEITVVAGKSGSGKSTIFRLLLRFYKCSHGEILLDDYSIYDYNKNVYAKNVSLVAQKPFVFDMTIRENLALVDRRPDRQIAACKLVGIHRDIMKLPKGYDTLLERDGENLSTGQKQLLSLARTLLSRSEVLLFDEVTSSLDSFTTDQVIKVLKKIKKHRTIIMITHKPELMRMADRILVVDKGRIVGKGTHRELMRTNEIYQSLQKIYEE